MDDQEIAAIVPATFSLPGLVSFHKCVNVPNANFHLFFKSFDIQ